jgi:hypothetical protein
MVTQRKSHPLMTTNGIMSFVQAIENLNNYASVFNYPYLVLQGTKDDVVSNTAIVQWHEKTSS